MEASFDQGCILIERMKNGTGSSERNETKEIKE